MSPSREGYPPPFLTPLSPVRWVVVEKSTQETAFGRYFTLTLQEAKAGGEGELQVEEADYEMTSIGDNLEQAYRRAGWTNLTPTKT